MVRIFLESGLEVDFEKLKANVAMLRGEIDSLYKLVEEAYHEGFTLGRRVGRSIRSQRTPPRAWDDSVAKRELAGAISSRSEELDK